MLELEAVAECGSVDEIFERLEAHEVVFRVDRSVVPTMMKGATLSVGELEQLRRIENVVRLGHVERIDLDEIVLEHGSIPTSPDHLHVHCATRGLSDNPPVPIFTDDTITLQVLVARQPVHVGGVIGFVEASGPDDRREEPAVPPEPVAAHAVRLPARHPDGDRDRDGMAGRRRASAWVNASRLNLVGGIVEHADQDAVGGAPGPVPHRTVPGAGEPRTARRASASDTERARIFDPQDA